MAAIQVSVPLRGLVMWKLNKVQYHDYQSSVSVPLRGLVMWKHHGVRPLILVRLSFSPLAGISYVETLRH